MKKFPLIIFAMILLFPSCRHGETGWTDLLDKDLSQWDNYLSYRFPAGYKGEVPRDRDGNEIPPIGLNHDKYNVFTVIEEDHTPVLRISGEIYGCVVTKKEYANYHLTLKVRWGNRKWDPRKKLLRDSGILYHSIGPFGAGYWRSWMLSQEFQVMEGHMGDYWSQKTSAIDIRAFLPENIMNPVADPSQPFLPMGYGEETPGFCLRSANYEHMDGGWNTLELICFEDKSLHIVNGHVVMILKNSRYDKDGQMVPLVRGKIQLQSEAAEVYYKDIRIRPLEKLPEEYARYFQ